MLTRDTHLADMKVLYVIDSLVPGGAERSLAAMAPHLVSGGVVLDIAYLKDRSGLQSELEEAGARLFRLDGGGGRGARISRTISLARARRPDLIHTTLFESDVAGRIAGRSVHVPVVSSLVGEHYGPQHFANPQRAAWKVHAAQLVDTVTARGVVRFHAITSHVADVMARRLHVRRDRIDVIPRGRDPEILGSRSTARGSRARLGVGMPSNAPLVVAAASQEHRKGIDVLIEAFPFVLEKVPRARLVVAGREGELTPTLRETIVREGLDETVRLLGERSDVPDLLSAADVFVMPSRAEGMGSVLLEAMALEAPIVASDLPAVRETLPDSTARLVRPNEPELLARAVVEALLDGDAARDRAVRAHSRFLHHFTIERVAEQMIQFYERAQMSATVDPEMWLSR
jgi:glycosyltransferase involved in cell wall biosynthesis